MDSQCSQIDLRLPPTSGDLTTIRATETSLACQRVGRLERGIVGVEGVCCRRNQSVGSTIDADLQVTTVECKLRSHVMVEGETRCKICAGRNVNGRTFKTHPSRNIPCTTIAVTGIWVSSIGSQTRPSTR